jgi:hypothetical protein
MKKSLYWEADSHSASEETPHLLWNRKVHYRVHKSLPLVPIQSNQICIGKILQCDMYSKSVRPERFGISKVTFLCPRVYLKRI